ncbi:MAG: four helix bundle protein [Elusimicrobia bacterium]|nr:four helix bundle protein [Elusimicrobiota bacterium]
MVLTKGSGVRGQGSVRNRIQSFRDLLVWQKAILLAKEIYGVTSKFPKEEQFGLVSQMRRASVSVSSNIAEGHCRQGAEFRYFLSIARGSLGEVESQLHLAVELRYLSLSDTLVACSLAEEIRKMIVALSKKLTPHPSPLTPAP